MFPCTWPLICLLCSFSKLIFEWRNPRQFHLGERSDLMTKTANTTERKRETKKRAWYFCSNDCWAERDEEKGESAFRSIDLGFFLSVGLESSGQWFVVGEREVKWKGRRRDGWDHADGFPQELCPREIRLRSRGLRTSPCFDRQSWFALDWSRMTLQWGGWCRLEPGMPLNQGVAEATQRY